MPVRKRRNVNPRRAGLLFSISAIIVLGAAFAALPVYSVAHAADLNSIVSVAHGGVVIVNGQTVLKKELTSSLNFWQWNFSWPHSVPNTQAMFVVFRGTFGHLDGGAPAQYANYDMQLQSFAAGTNAVAKQISILPLKLATDSPYTAAIFEVDPAHLADGYNKEIEWFASGGTSGIAPLNYAFLTFNYRQYAECCSSVAFIPGIEGTELFENNNRVWLPGLFNSDANRLAMDSNGSSINNILVGQPVKNAYIFFEVYNQFLNFLDTLKTNHTIADWKALSYDWRYDVYDAASNDQHLHDGTVLNMANEIRALAAASDTGKVTLITHSNGGLVGKALITALGSDANLIDKFVMVGTPELGTPSSIPALLHGYEQGLPLDSFAFTMNQSTARSLSANMPGAYGLLPLANYFNTVLDPVVEFDNSSLTAAFRATYGTTIHSAAQLQSFLLGGDGRSQPAANDIADPSILNNTLLTKELATRSALESWTPPTGMEVDQVAGWGLDTLRGYHYVEKKCPAGAGCTTFLDIQPLMTAEGDQTVVTPSADAQTGANTYFFNMNGFNNANNTSWTHANMLAAQSVRDLLGEMIDNATRTAPFISTTSPQSSDASKRLRISVHSPATLSVRDPEGRFTGVEQNPDPTSDIPIIVQDIPNSFYMEFGEGKYIGVDANEARDVILKGTDDGTVTLNVDEVTGNTVTNSVSYSSVPVSTTTTIDLHIQDLSNTSALQVDENSDGVVDQTIDPDSAQQTPNQQLQAFRAKVASLHLPPNITKHLTSRSFAVEKVLSGNRKRNTVRAKLFLLEIELYIRAHTNKRHGSVFTDAQMLISMLEAIRKAL